MANIPGTAGDDTLYGTPDADLITGDAGNDRLWGFDGDDTLEGGVDSDILDGGTGADTMRGGAGDDYYIVDNIGDQVVENAGEGAELVYTTIDYALTDNVERLAVYSRASTFAVNLTGNALDNELIGNNGNNVLNGAGGNDILQGGLGDDTFIVDSALDTVIEQAGGGTDTIRVSTVTGSALHNGFEYSIRENNPYGGGDDPHIERLVVDDATTTNSVNLHGSFEDNVLLGNAGINILEGWGGNDMMVGYGGDDIYFVAQTGDQVVEQAGQGYDTVYIGSYHADAAPAVDFTSYTLGDNFERLLMAINGKAMTLIGNAVDNEIAGNNVANIIDGGLGADIMQGMGGNDIYIVDNPLDRVYESAVTGFDYIRTKIDYTAGPNIEGLYAYDEASTDPLRLVGGANTAQMIGNAGANILDNNGRSGSMIGLGGDDTYIVYFQYTSVFEEAGGGLDTVWANNIRDFQLWFNVERVGVNGNTTTHTANLIGNALNNEIWGNNGANGLDGGAGNDVMYGYGGADLFIFSTAPGANNVDVLPDYEAGVDRFALEDGVFTGLSRNATALEASFTIGTAAQDADDRLIYDPNSGNLYYDSDGTGANAAVRFAVVHEHLNITFADFFIY